jgi:hypothetical protein
MSPVALIVHGLCLGKVGSSASGAGLFRAVCRGESDTDGDSMKTRIHVNQHRIKANRKDGELRPVLTCKSYKSNEYGHEAVIRDDDGNEVCRIVYRPFKPLSCGAHVWVETQLDVEVINHDPVPVNSIDMEPTV